MLKAVFSLHVENVYFDIPLNVEGTILTMDCKGFWTNQDGTGKSFSVNQASFESEEEERSQAIRSDRRD